MSPPLPQVPLLTIVVPVLDEAAGIADALAPLQALRAAGVELIVVDGGSADDTFASAKPLCDRVIVAPRGRGRQMHEGASVANGDILLFLHADTVLPKGAVEAIRRAVDGGAAWGRFDVAIAGSSPMLPVIATMMNLRSRLTGIATGDQAIFVTREAYEAAGGFPDIPLMEDIAFSRALRRCHHPACLRERVTTSGRRWEKHGVAATVLKMWVLACVIFWVPTRSNWRPTMAIARACPCASPSSPRRPFRESPRRV